MKTKLQSPAIFFLILGLFILSCGPASQVLETPANTDLPSATQESPVVVTPEETPTATSVSHPGFYAPFGLLLNKDFGALTDGDFGLCSYCDYGVEVAFSGEVCSLEQPFALTDADEDFGVLQFTPSGPQAGIVNISGGWVLERSSEGITIEGNYTVEDSQSNAGIPEGNVGLHITTPSSCFESPIIRNAEQGCFPLDSWIYLSPLETTECSSP